MIITKHYMNISKDINIIYLEKQISYIGISNRIEMLCLAHCYYEIWINIFLCCFQFQSILHFWLDKEVDGFHVQNVQYLYEDKNLRDETLTVGKPGKVGVHEMVDCNHN